MYKLINRFSFCMLMLCLNLMMCVSVCVCEYFSTKISRCRVNTPLDMAALDIISLISDALIRHLICNIITNAQQRHRHTIGLQVIKKYNHLDCVLWTILCEKLAGIGIAPLVVAALWILLTSFLTLG